MERSMTNLFEHNYCDIKLRYLRCFIIMIKLNGTNYYTASEILTAYPFRDKTFWRWRSNSKVPLGRNTGKQLVFTESEFKSITEFAIVIESLSEPKEQLSLFASIRTQ